MNTNTRKLFRMVQEFIENGLYDIVSQDDGSESFGNGRESQDDGSESYGNGRESQVDGSESYGNGRESQDDGSKNYGQGRARQDVLSESFEDHSVGLSRELPAVPAYAVSADQVQF